MRFLTPTRIFRFLILITVAVLIGVFGGKFFFSGGENGKEVQYRLREVSYQRDLPEVPAPAIEAARQMPDFSITNSLLADLLPVITKNSDNALPNDQNYTQIYRRIIELNKNVLAPIAIFELANYSGRMRIASKVGVGFLVNDSTLVTSAHVARIANVLGEGLVFEAAFYLLPVGRNKDMPLRLVISSRSVYKDGLLFKLGEPSYSEDQLFAFYELDIFLQSFIRQFDIQYFSPADMDGIKTMDGVYIVSPRLEQNGVLSPFSSIIPTFVIFMVWKDYFTEAEYAYLEEIYPLSKVITRAQLLDVSIGVVSRPGDSGSPVVVFDNASETFQLVGMVETSVSTTRVDHIQKFLAQNGIEIGK